MSPNFVLILSYYFLYNSTSARFESPIFEDITPITISDDISGLSYNYISIFNEKVNRVVVFNTDKHIAFRQLKNPNYKKGKMEDFFKEFIGLN